MRAVLSVTILSSVCLLLALVLTGCGMKMPGQAKATKKATTESGSSSGGGGGGGGFAAQQNIRQAAKRVEYGPELKGIAMVYMDYNLTNGRPPTRLDDIRATMQRDNRKALALVEDGTFVIVWNVKNPTSNQVVVYVKDLDSHGTRQVAFGDCSVQRLTDAEFKKVLAGR